MEKLNKLSLPITIIIASLILGGFYYASQISKQNSIERQQARELQAERDVEQVKKDAEASARLGKMFCVDQAKNSAIEQYSTSNLCTGSYAPDDCKDGRTYLVANYENAYKICLQSKGLE